MFVCLAKQYLYTASFTSTKSVEQRLFLSEEHWPHIQPSGKVKVRATRLTPYSIKLDHTSQFVYFTSGLVAVGSYFSTKGGEEGGLSLH